MAIQDNDRSDEPVAPPGRLSSLPLIGHVLGNPSLRNRDFHKLCGSSAFNNIGMSGELVIIGILIFEITQSSTWVGIAVALYNLPMLVFGLLSGAIADWMDRRTLLRRVELVVVINLVIFSALIAMVPADLWLILLFAVVSGSIRDSAYAARISYAYDLVGGQHIVAGLSLLNLASRVGQLIGALAGGIVMQNYGAPAAILCLAAAHAVAFILLSQLRSAGSVETVERVPIGQSLRQCFIEMRSNRVLLMLIIITGGVEVFGFSFSTTLPELAATRFSVGAKGLGEMHAMRAIGGILAALILAAFVGPQKRGAIYLFVICAFGGGLILLSAANQFALALAALIIIAGLASASDVLTQSMMQLSVPDHLRGRAMGLWVFAIGWAPVGHLEMGSFAENLGVSAALQINGTALISVGVIAAIFVPRLRKL
ncbi:MAG: MFS transporter [Rhodospirillales bacterium]|nr:MFS transporter [Rhodospirillales bacterium]